MKTAGLTGAALNWVVTHINYEINGDHIWATEEEKCNYAEDWAQAGPIIERERITIQFDGDEIRCDLTTDSGGFFVGSDEINPLIAAMRCYVASKLGDEVEIPKELQ
tara:strand:+ start:282 stop:602 length:321 start_codon:yes stop_codon:yes gene_type:complete